MVIPDPNTLSFKKPIAASDDAARSPTRVGPADPKLLCQLNGHQAEGKQDSKQGSWHHRHGKPTWATNQWRHAAPQAAARLRHLAEAKRATDEKTQAAAKGADNAAKPRIGREKNDVEAQHTTVGDVLFSGFADELEDLTPEERDLLVRYAFQHTALRAKRPVVWIPRDKLGVSDDEIKRARKMSTVPVPGSLVGEREKGDERPVDRTNIWMSNEGTALDGKGRVLFRRSPPDFSNVDLIAL